MPQATNDDADTPGAPMCLTARQVKRLEPEQTLVLGVSEHVVALCREGTQSYILGRFSAPAFRLFVVLVLAEEGATYAELYAALRCTEACFRAVLAAASLQVAAFQEEVQRHGQALGRLKRNALEVERKQIRRVIFDSSGVAPALESGGFGCQVENQYGRGYRLISAEETTSDRPRQLSMDGFLLDGLLRPPRARKDPNRQ
jgi:hypothetical protein